MGKENKNLNLYLGGHMLNRANIMLREWERDQIKALGIDLYVPHENKDINDKEANKHTNDDLAERIVKADLERMMGCNVAMMEYQPEALGTTMEIAMFYMFNKLYDELHEILNDNTKTNDDKLSLIKEYFTINPRKKVMCHCQDIRRHDAPRVGDRREWSCNAFVLGVVNALHDGKKDGFMEYDEIWSELKELKNIE
jgi:hypothetical protein